MIRAVCLFAVVAVLVLVLAPAAHADLRFGVVAPRGEAKAEAAWAPLGAHLSEELDEVVTIVPVTPGSALEALERRRFDVLLGNPVHAAVARESQGARLLASLVKPAGTRFAGVIVARADSGIRTGTDLRGKRVISLKRASAGAFLFQAVHLMDQGVAVPGDFAAHAVGENQDELVRAVAEGTYDAAFVRTGILEAMAREGSIDIADFVVVDGRIRDGLDLLHSTRLYPEWFLVAAAWIDEAKATALTEALFAVPVDHPALETAGVLGFVQPEDLEPVVDALRRVERLPFSS